MKIHATGSGYEASNAHITMQWVPTAHGEIRSYVKLVGSDWNMPTDFVRRFRPPNTMTNIEAVQRDWDRVNTPTTTTEAPTP